MPPTTSISVLFHRFGSIYKTLGALSERRVVSKPQILSRLRHVNIVRRGDETAEERKYRLRCAYLQKWNSEYWAQNNETFTREKNEFIEKNFGSELAKDEALSHDQLAAFYRSFLEKNRLKHIAYNRIWYRNHIALLTISLNAKISRLKADLLRR